MDAQSGFQIGTFSLGTLAGIIIGALLGHVLTNIRSKKEYLQRAKDQFREELQADLVELQDQQKDPYEVINSAIKRHLLAKARFERYLKGSDLEGFVQAWNEYYLIDAGGGHMIPFVEQYFSAGSINKRKEMRATAIRRIEQMISYAEPIR
jgi:hypothetical protein